MAEIMKLITAKFKTLGRFQNFQGAPVFGSKYPFLVVSVTLLRLCHGGAHYIIRRAVLRRQIPGFISGYYLLDI
jgi:hypothetical protein